MVQMVPNCAIVKATVTKIMGYEQAEGFCILVLNVKDATQKKDMAFLFNKDDDKEIKVIVSDQKKNELQLKVKDNIEAELKKVNIDLWKANENNFKVK